MWRIRFDSQAVGKTDTPCIPQDLSIAPTITQEPLDDPKLLPRQHIAGSTLLSTDVIQINTQSNAVPGVTSRAWGARRFLPKLACRTLGWEARADVRSALQWETIGYVVDYA